MIFTRYRKRRFVAYSLLYCCRQSQGQSVTGDSIVRVRTVCHTVDQGDLVSVISTWIYLRLAADRRHWSIEKGPLMDNYARSWPCVKKGEYTMYSTAQYSMDSKVKFSIIVGLGWIRNCFLGMQIRSPHNHSTYRKCTVRMYMKVQ